MSNILLLIFFGFFFAFSSPHGGMRYSPLVLSLRLPDHKWHIFGFDKIKVGPHHLLERVKPVHRVTTGVVESPQPQVLHNIHGMTLTINMHTRTHTHTHTHRGDTMMDWIQKILLRREIKIPGYRMTAEGAVK